MQSFSVREENSHDDIHQTLRRGAARRRLLALGGHGLAADESQARPSAAPTYTKWLWGNQRVRRHRCTTSPPSPARATATTGRARRSSCSLERQARRSRSRSAAASTAASTRTSGRTSAASAATRSNRRRPCIGGDCGEFDPRSNQYVKLRGVAVTLTPGYKWIDSATIGANDFGHVRPLRHRPHPLHRPRQRVGPALPGLGGATASSPGTWSASRCRGCGPAPTSRPASYTAADAAYGAQVKLHAVSSDVRRRRHLQVRQRHRGRRRTTTTSTTAATCSTRFRNAVVGVKFGIHPAAKLDIRAAFYHSVGRRQPAPWAPASTSAASPASRRCSPASTTTTAWKINVDLNDPFGIGFSFNVEGLRHRRRVRRR